MNDARRKDIRAILDKFDIGPLQELLGNIEEVRDAEQEAFENLPESLQDGDRGAAMEDNIAKLQVAADCLTNAIETIEEAEGELQEVG